MKIFKYSGIALLLAGAMLSSCSKNFLDKPSYGALTENDMATKAGIKVMLIGAYAALDGQAPGNNALGGSGSGWMASPTNWVYGSVAGGDAHKGSESTDQSDINTIAIGQESSTNTFINAKWKAVYEGVTRCNITLRLLRQTKDMTADEKKQVEAECRFLRGHYYFELKKMFNNVPLITDTTTDVMQPNTVNIWPFIEADFTFAMNTLPETQTEVGRANKWAAQIYLAKTLLYEKQYPQAYTLFQGAINAGVTSNGKKYALVPNFEDNFDASKKNGPESVFAVQMTANDGTGSISNANAGDMLNYPYNSPFGCCGFFQPTQDLVNSYRTDSISGLPYIDNYNDPGNVVKNDMKVAADAAFTPDAGYLDPRLDWTVGRRGLPYHDWGLHPGAKWVRDQNSGGPYAGKKMIFWQYNQNLYRDNNSWAPGSAINVVLIRFADVLLMAAECAVETGDLAGAEAYVNQVRGRIADNPASWLHKYVVDTLPLKGFSTTDLAAKYKISRYPDSYFASQDQARKIVYFERKLELATEGHRYFDIARWGQAGADMMNKFYQYENTITTDLVGGIYKVKRNEYFPIPQRQIDLSIKNGKSVLTQNSGY
ncbi:MAG: RagB/SusD family nutrient uptake outer membrane protein [Chitinophaga sp.]|uniref:RagB/SusD family nutrient uptake outer membrane protein n=1 Tax=Chitinophaga sp. TaxID=1869181 RepID=UPI0025C21A34|nr:RagB/SusD family nutrient uptake outer membrane protein [Chitinophaga sp.]MBV8255306.1 RagB/SusD family nutrient uptake outer membrane protein [Chitinophaga sp.]